MLFRSYVISLDDKSLLICFRFVRSTHKEVDRNSKIVCNVCIMFPFWLFLSIFPSPYCAISHSAQMRNFILVDLFSGYQVSESFRELVFWHALSSFCTQDVFHLPWPWNGRSNNKTGKPFLISCIRLSASTIHTYCIHCPYRSSHGWKFFGPTLAASTRCSVL